MQTTLPAGQNTDQTTDPIARSLHARNEAVRALGMALEIRGADAAGHTDRLAMLAVTVGRALGLSESQLDDLRIGAYLHDIGKLGIPDAILRKPERLDDVEWHVMRGHTVLGHAQARALSFANETILAIVRNHHERWDGTGYPDRLAGPAIPFAARIVAVCDVYESLTSDRPYRDAWLREEAIEEIVVQRGRQFDPSVVDAFLHVVEEPAPVALAAD